MEILILGISHGVYLSTSDSFTMDQINTDFKTNNALLINTDTKETHIGNAQVFGKYFPFETVDETKSHLYVAILQNHFSNDDFFEKIVSKLLSLSDESN